MAEGVPAVLACQPCGWGWPHLLEVAQHHSCALPVCPCTVAAGEASVLPAASCPACSAAPVPAEFRCCSCPARCCTAAANCTSRSEPARLPLVPPSDLQRECIRWAFVTANSNVCMLPTPPGSRQAGVQQTCNPSASVTANNNPHTSHTPSSRRQAGRRTNGWGHTATASHWNR